MNVLLEKLFDKYYLDEKDKYEIRQIYQIVDDEKKRNIISNFDNIMFSINKLKESMKVEQEILLGKAISNIERALDRTKRVGIQRGITDEILNLKGSI